MKPVSVFQKVFILEIQIDPEAIFRVELSNATLNLELLITSLISATLAFFAIVISSKIASRAASENTKAIVREMNVRLASEKLLAAQQGANQFISDSEAHTLDDDQGLKKLRFEADKLNLVLTIMDLTHQSSSPKALPDSPTRTDIAEWKKSVIDQSTTRIKRFAEQLAEL